MDVVEQLHHQLAALAEPLAKETVAVDLDEGDMAVAAEVADRQLLRQRFTERRLSCSRRTVEQQQSVEGDDRIVDMMLRKEKGRCRVVEQIRLHVVVIYETS